MTSAGKVGVGIGILLAGAVGFVAGRESMRSEFPNVVTGALSKASPGAEVAPPATRPAQTMHDQGWQVSIDTSPMDDSRTVILSLVANESIRAWPSETHTPTLMIRCKEHETDLYVVNGAQPNVEYGETDAATVRLRLDSAAAYSQLWNKSTDGVALFARNPVILAKRLSAASMLTYQFTPFNSAPVTTTFTLDGLAGQLSQVATACGWKP